MMSEKSDHIFPIETLVSLSEREHRNAHRAVCLWFTGLSGSGKSTIANALVKALFDQQMQAYLLDGDNIRSGINSDLGFSEADRKENIRRIGEVARLFVDAGHIVATAFISPFRSDREAIRNLLGPARFLEVFVDCPLDICMQRDPKKLYQKARAGEIKNFTGIDSPYESPESPDIHLNNDGSISLEQQIIIISEFLQDKGITGKALNV
jgi:adenylylsulfate kinase